MWSIKNGIRRDAVGVNIYCIIIAGRNQEIVGIEMGKLSAIFLFDKNEQERVGIIELRVHDGTCLAESRCDLLDVELVIGCTDFHDMLGMRLLYFSYREIVVHR